MRYIYMHNFRGFSDTLVPLCDTNFLVGENSTGKSSFLSLLYAMNQSQFVVNSELIFGPGGGPYAFSDLFSAWPTDSTRFRVGRVEVREHHGKFGLFFSVYEFGNRAGNLKLMRFTRSRPQDGLTVVDFERPSLRYCRQPSQGDFGSNEDALMHFRKMTVAPHIVIPVPRQISKELSVDTPLPIILPLLGNVEKNSPRLEGSFNIEMMRTTDITWIAPIRTRPRRTYDGINVGYSPEGEHAPTLLRKTLKASSKSREFVRHLKAFGAASGLYETITPHTFGKGDKTPFELLVKFVGAELNISNVGYGVSQVLPLIVEFLSSDKPRTFVVQQPEVHLHPRAQAALGGLVHQLSRDRKHTFFVETHSDFLIDRYRLEMKRRRSSQTTQILFFNRSRSGNVVHSLRVGETGLYPMDQPKDFRGFFVREGSRLLSL